MCFIWRKYREKQNNDWCRLSLPTHTTTENELARLAQAQLDRDFLRIATSAAGWKFVATMQHLMFHTNKVL